MPYRKTIEETVKLFQTDKEKGLSQKEALARLERFGKNEIEDKQKPTVFKIILEQINDPMILILLVCAGISFVLGEEIDCIIILCVICINAFIGAFQQMKAEKALEALKKLSASHALVKRENELKEIEISDLVIGDLVILQEGSYIPADLRLIEAKNLKVDESSLTGESTSVLKDDQILYDRDISLADQKNMAFSSTFVTSGRGKGIVVKTAMDTEIGKIASMLKEEKQDQTPLQKRLAELSKLLGMLCIGICVVIFVVGLLQKRNLFEMLITSISLAVAAIPEGLPAVVSISLALGVQKMSKNNAIARKLHAVETLGSVSMICSDKTGTLTQNKMQVKAVFADQVLNNRDTAMKVDRYFVEAMLLCNDATANSGDPTEKALVEWSESCGLNQVRCQQEKPRIDEVPFDSKSKMMITVHKSNEGEIIYIKGACEVILSKCKTVWINGRKMPLNKERISKINEAYTQMGNSALRVLGCAMKLTQNHKKSDLENGYTFLGMVGMIDPPRTEVFEALKIAKNARIDVAMITGDHPDTAFAIAKELNIATHKSQVLSGKMIDEMSQESLIRQVEKVRVFARVSPENKVRIVEAFQACGHVVSMSGDGVNDAPSLKRADVGIAMGSGTDVAKQAGDVILSDDNFATIVKAIEKGRNIYLNIKKAVLYLLSCNLGEVSTLFFAIILMPNGATVLNAVQILWINLITDAFPALALAVEPDDPNCMKVKPRDPKESIFAEHGLSFTVLNGLYIGTISLVAFRYGLQSDLTCAHTMAFMVLSITQLIHCLNLRDMHRSLFVTNIFANPYLLVTIVLGTTIEIAVAQLPFFNMILKTCPLSMIQWGVVFALSFSILIINELSKLSWLIGKKN